MWMNETICAGENYTYMRIYALSDVAIQLLFQHKNITGELEQTNSTVSKSGPRLLMKEKKNVYLRPSIYPKWRQADRRSVECTRNNCGLWKPIAFQQHSFFEIPRPVPRVLASKMIVSRITFRKVNCHTSVKLGVIRVINLYS